MAQIPLKFARICMLPPKVKNWPTLIRICKEKYPDVCAILHKMPMNNNFMGYLNYFSTLGSKMQIRKTLGDICAKKSYKINTVLKLQKKKYYNTNNFID